MDVASRGGARGRPRDAPVALELDERPLVPVHLQQHRVPDSHRGRGLDPGSGGGGGAPGSPPSSVMFVGVSAAGSGHARAGGGGGLVRFRGRGARRGGAVGAVAALPMARGGRTTFSLGRSRPVSRGQRRDQTRLVLPRFSKAASAAVPPLDVRASSRRDEPPAVRPLRPHPRRERAGRDRAARRRARTRKRGRAVSEGGGLEVGEAGVVGVGAVEPPRPASPTPAAPRAFHRTARRERNSSVARAELLEMEREARALRNEEDAWYVRDGICAKVPPRVVREDASRRVNREEPARCRVPRYPPPLPRSLEVVPTIFVLEAKARREEEEEVMDEEERRAE